MTEMDDGDDRASASSDGLARRFLAFLGSNKRWWLTPILLFLAFLVLMAVLGFGVMLLGMLFLDAVGGGGGG